ncbi:hypothetical protein BN59_01222 [Legionella massiliensis]|uniref:ATPases involved in biogenesis of archaeal flagella n=1 Tax=Legionella massiliensis TaxID=1034943 RepID=A0A078KZ22_9GAMM|nr:hypothetical protein [Legionella massiliensis]CDZ76943.1 hypothetical protein BN59_01222 [Legionella massiliensis]CEE12681.1 hypothetical protein BN1094_01222 [Legionella massiliensis]
MMRFFLGLCLLAVFSVHEVCAETLEIQASGQKTKLTYWAAQSKIQYGGLLIVAGGEPQDGIRVLKKLCRRLSKSGWSVAFLNAYQLGDKANWTAQLPEALSALRQKNISNLVLLHYGAQLGPLLDYFSKLQQINGLILLSAFDLKSPTESAASLEKIAFPVFDMVGQFDYDTVSRQAALRRKTVHSNNYLQYKLPGAAHDYAYTDAMLAAYLHGWMRHLAPKKTPDNLSAGGPPTLRIRN